ncbi:HAD family hydrolase [Candidatus Lokiarchaeum ossiferum]|uniref:HAD family hydrolase n=1 Tax=Candidatus Lokiarchaeum ossiferum TaxID=2951803 RepID=UPI00352C0976
MEKYDVILFDLDGTLTDPKKGIINSIKYALKKLNISNYDPKTLVEFIGPPLDESFEYYFHMDHDQALTAINYYREYFKVKGLFENQIYPGIPELMKRIHDQKRKIYVATSKPTPFAKDILNHFKIADYCVEIVGSNLNLTRVKKADIIEYVLQKIPQCPRERIVMVGDRKYDIIGAKDTKIDSIGVTYGYGNLEEIKHANPTMIAHSVAELSHLLL